MCALTPKISCSTTMPPRALPCGFASHACSVWPSAALRSIQAMSVRRQAGRTGAGALHGFEFVHLLRPQLAVGRRDAAVLVDQRDAIDLHEVGFGEAHLQRLDVLGQV